MGINEYGDDDACYDQIGDKDIPGCKLCNGRNILDLFSGGCNVCLSVPNQDCSQDVQDQKNQFHGRVGGGDQSGEDPPQTDFGDIGLFWGFQCFHSVPRG